MNQDREHEWSTKEWENAVNRLQRTSYERRILAAQRDRRYRWGLIGYGSMAAIGAGLLVSQITTDVPYIPLVMVGIMMVVPVIVHWSIH